jgi:two-component system sensor histidine kinase YesM
MVHKLKDWFYDLPIKTKLIILLVIASIVPLLLVSFYNFSAARNQRIDQAYRNIEVMNLQIANNINDQFENLLLTSSLLYSDTTLEGYLTKSYVKDWDFVLAYQYINRTFYNILSSNHKISYLSIYVDNRSLPSDGHFIRHLAAGSDGTAGLGTEIRYLGKENYTSLISNSNGERVIYLRRSLNRNHLRNPYGYLEIGMKEETIFSLFENEAANKDIYIVDPRGTVQSTRDKTLLDKNIIDVLGVDVLSGPIWSGQVLDIHGEKKMIMLTNLQNGWKTISITPLNKIYQEVTMASVRSLLISFVCVVIALLLSFQISQYFSSRFQLVMKQIALIEQNNFHTNLELEGKDEIGRLSWALNTMAQTLDKAIHENYIKALQVKETELMLLQSQVNPHFLYNSLSGISSLALSNKNKEIVAFSNHLSQFYRTSLNHGKKYITIAEEIEITKHYIAIQNTRFPGMFNFVWDITPSVLNKNTLKLILQPIIENIVNHAVKDDSQPLTAIICIYPDADRIFYKISDDGMGIAYNKMNTLLDPEKASGFGLINVNARIKLSFGDNYGVSISSQLGQGTIVLVCIPNPT